MLTSHTRRTRSPQMRVKTLLALTRVAEGVLGVSEHPVNSPTAYGAKNRKYAGDAYTTYSVRTHVQI